MPKVLTNRRVQLLSGALIVSIVLLAGGSIGVASAVGSTSDDANSFLRSSASSKVYDADGDLIANLHGEINRDPVPLKEMPEALRQAAVAIEDRRFYEHRGVDVRGLSRAVMTNLRNGDRQGGSTITQQLAKNLYHHGESRTVWRKATEVVLALGLENKTDKDSILEAYLNTAYFGRGVYGVQTAASSYFRKDVKDLTLADSAFLAGLIHAPSRYDYSVSDTPEEQQERRDAAISRRDRVLDAMADVGYITRDEAREAAGEPVVLHAPRDPRWKHPYFVDAALRELGVLRNTAHGLDERFDFLGETREGRADSVYRDGLRIYTTLDRNAQTNAERALTEQLPEGTLPKLSSAVVTVEPGTGAVRALIGGRDYYPKGCDEGDPANARPLCHHAKVNLALGNLAGGSGRQPGSSFKPIVLASALEHGLSLKQTLDGSPFSYKYEGGEWKVANYEGSAGGTMSVVDATVKSVNGAYARLEIGYLGDGDGIKGATKVAETARKLGIGFPTEKEIRDRCKADYGKNGGCTAADHVPAIALGAKEVSPLEMAGAYATFANEGVYAKPTTISKIVDADGKVLYEARPQTRRAVSRETALGVSHILQQVIQRGTGRAAALPDRSAAGKTGTSQEWRDAWFNGYIPQLATAVWVGNPVPVQRSNGSWSIESMTPSNGYGTRITGGSYPARIWSAHMAPTVEGLELEAFPDVPQELFERDPKKLVKSKGEKDITGGGIGETMELRRNGANVVVHRECPPGGGTRGITVWKQEQRGDETHVWRSRAVCR